MPASGPTKLLDANIWLALAFSDHAHHLKALTWFDRQLDGTCAFCRITQLALLRHLTNVSIMGKFVQTQVQAWQTFDSYLSDPRVAFAMEPLEVEVEFRNLSRSTFPAHLVWTDSYLAAFARAANFSVVTFDKGFQRFGPTSLELLNAD